MAWIGRKKLAFVPLYRTNATPPDQIPPHWPDLIMKRVFFDKDPITHTDRSLRAYIHTVSSGVADLDVVVMPMVSIAGQNILPDALEGQMGNQLRAHGFDGAAIVMLGGPGAGSTGGYWSRFVMAEPVGVWAGECMHQTNLCDFGDLFPFGGDFPSGENMGPFDQMAGFGATHPSAYTKRAVGWLDRSVVPTLPGPTAEDYTLHSISLVQPPPSGRVAAVQIGRQVPYLMVEARQRADQFDRNIPSEGVIVYRVQTTNPRGWVQGTTCPLALLTKSALAAGQSFASDGATVQVNSSVPGGFSITVNDPTNTQITQAVVPDVTGWKKQAASDRILNAGFIPQFNVPTQFKNSPASSLWVYSQSPAGESIALLGTTVTLTLHGGNVF